MSRPKPTSTISKARSRTRSRCRASAPSAASAATWTTSSCSTTTPRSPIPRRFSATTSRRGAARCSARRRFRGSTRTSTRPSRSSYASKDGAKVPMFLTHRKGLVLDGNNPTLMYGYGGFNIATTPGFNSLRIALLEQGFVYASVNMRGGSEYGEAWHDAGTKTKKQNVFDDFIAAAEWLIANKYTSPAKLAVARRIERRPAGRRGDQPASRAVPRRDPAGRRHGHAALPQVHDRLELDRGLRLERQRRRSSRRSTPTRRCTTSSRGRSIPRRSITTADHDDRVVPAHSFKYAATLQEKASKEKPVLIRIETKSRPRREQRHEADRIDGRHLRVHHAQPGRDADGVFALVPRRAVCTPERRGCRFVAPPAPHSACERFGRTREPAAAREAGSAPEDARATPARAHDCVLCVQPHASARS